jgi:hypothetical protein
LKQWGKDATFIFVEKDLVYLSIGRWLAVQLWERQVLSAFADAGI